MGGDDLKFEEFLEVCDEQYEYGLIEFKNGDIVNGPGENDGSAKVLSYGALAGFDKEMTLKVGSGVDFETFLFPHRIEQQVFNFFRFCCNFFNFHCVTRKALGTILPGCTGISRWN